MSDPEKTDPNWKLTHGRARAVLEWLKTHPDYALAGVWFVMGFIAGAVFL